MLGASRCMAPPPFCASCSSLPPPRLPWVPWPCVQRLSREQGAWSGADPHSEVHLVKEASVFNLLWQGETHPSPAQPCCWHIRGV